MESRSTAESPSTTTVVQKHPYTAASSSKPSNLCREDLQSESARKLEDESVLDSGYGSQDSSQAATPDRLANESGSDPKERGIELRLSKTKTLLAFNDEIGELYKTRFYSIQPTVESLLLQYVRRKSFLRGSGRHKPMAIRLLFLGNSELDAKPHIVVFCAPEMRKRVQHFFEKDELVKAFYKPEDTSLPSFEVAVCECAPQWRNGEAVVEVFSDAIANKELASSIVYKTPFSSTFCGTPIRLEANGKTKNATLGGLVKLEYDTGKSELLGLTAGHAVRACLEDETDEGVLDGALDAGDDESTDSSFVDSDSDGNYSDAEGTMTEDSDSYTSIKRVAGDVVDAQPWAFKHPQLLGGVRWQGDATQDKKQPPKGSFDWALINLNELKPNRLPAFMFQENLTQWSEGIAKYRNQSPAMASALSEDRVILMCGSSRPKFGYLASQPARILIDTSDVFVNAFMVILDPGDEIVDGDSGSWVVTEDTHEVIGHIVATDALGAGYIIPLCDIFSDIQQSLGVAHVSLPSVGDIKDVQLTQTHAETTPDTGHNCQVSRDTENGDFGKTHINKREEEEHQSSPNVNLSLYMPPEVVAISAPATFPFSRTSSNDVSIPDIALERSIIQEDREPASILPPAYSDVPCVDSWAEGRTIRESSLQANEQTVKDLAMRGKENRNRSSESQSQHHGQQRIVPVDVPPAPRRLSSHFNQLAFVPYRREDSISHDSGYSSHGGSSRNSSIYGSVPPDSTRMSSTVPKHVMEDRPEIVALPYWLKKRQQQRQILAHFQAKKGKEDEKAALIRAKIAAANAEIASRPSVPQPSHRLHFQPLTALDDIQDDLDKGDTVPSFVEFMLLQDHAARTNKMQAGRPEEEAIVRIERGENEARKQRLLERIAQTRRAAVEPESFRSGEFDEYGVYE